MFHRWDSVVFNYRKNVFLKGFIFLGPEFKTTKKEDRMFLACEKDFYHIITDRILAPEKRFTGNPDKINMRREFTYYRKEVKISSCRILLVEKKSFIFFNYDF